MASAPLLERGEPHGFDFRLRLAEFGEDAQCFRRFGLVDPAHGEPDMNEHPIADAGCNGMILADDAGNIDLPSDAADIDGRQFAQWVVDSLDTAGNAKTHGDYSFFRWLAPFPIKFG